MILDILKFLIRPVYIYITKVKMYLKYKFKYPSLKLKGNCFISNSKFGKNVGLYDSTLSNSDIGDFSYLAKDAFVNHAEIGRYCSIGPGVKIGLGQHPTRDFISTHPVFYSSNSFTGGKKSCRNLFKEFAKTKIGSDVWIGANAIVKDGITLGNGVIIAAGAVVTKDIPDFAIVGGMPAVIIKYRFTKEIIEKLLDLKWWDHEVLNIIDYESIFSNVDNISTLEKAIKNSRESF